MTPRDNYKDIEIVGDYRKTNFVLYLDIVIHMCQLDIVFYFKKRLFYVILIYDEIFMD